MNELIRELYQQAHMVREYPADDPWRGGNPPSVYWGGERSAEKFALLIVRECADIIGKVPNGYQDYRNQIEDAMRDDCLQAILKHFGVEE